MCRSIHVSALLSPLPYFMVRIHCLGLWAGLWPNPFDVSTVLGREGKGSRCWSEVWHFVHLVTWFVTRFYRTVVSLFLSALFWSVCTRCAFPCGLGGDICSNELDRRHFRQTRQNDVLQQQQQQQLEYGLVWPVKIPLYNDERTTVWYLFRDELKWSCIFTSLIPGSIQVSTVHSS